MESRLQSFTLAYALFVFLSCAGGVLQGCADLLTVRHCAVQTAAWGGADFQVNISRYGDSQDAQKALLIFPPTGGTGLIDRSYAREFCAKGYDVFILNSWTDQDEKATDLELHQRFYGRAQKALALGLAQTSARFVGLLGTSVGALHASISAATVERLNAVFVIVGGAPIAEVVVHSDQGAMRKLRSARYTLFSFPNDSVYAEAIAKAFQLEPMQLGNLYKKKDLGMVIAQNDLTVPVATQNRLRDFWQPKKVIVLSNNHLFAIIKTWLFHAREVVDFFEESAHLVLHPVARSENHSNSN